MILPAALDLLSEIERTPSRLLQKELPFLLAHIKSLRAKGDKPRADFLSVVAQEMDLSIAAKKKVTK